MVRLLVTNGEISFEESAVFIDGTKIEANASRYSFVWKTKTTKNQVKLGEKIANELPLLLEKAGVGIAAPRQITLQRLKKLRKKLYAQKEDIPSSRNNRQIALLRVIAGGLVFWCTLHSYSLR